MHYLFAILKLGVLFAAILIIYGQDLLQIFERSLEFETGNISNYIFALPFLILYVIYRKREKIKSILLYNDDNTTSSLIPTKNEIIGIPICAFAVVLFLYGPSMYALESNLLSFVIFGIGATMLLFGFNILKQIGFAFVL